MAAEVIYNASNGVFTVLEGRVRATVRVTAINDADVEGMDRTNVTLGKATGFDDSWSDVDAGNNQRNIRIEPNDSVIQFSAAGRQQPVVRDQNVTLELSVNDGTQDHGLPVRISVGDELVYHDIVPNTLPANDTHDVTFSYPSGLSPTASEVTSHP